MTDLLQSPEQARDEGIRRAYDSNERSSPDWGDRAYAFLCWYALTCAMAGGLSFTSEAVSDEFIKRGNPPPDKPKAWGKVYIRAKNAGVIKIVGSGVARKRHMSTCNLWGPAKHWTQIEVPSPFSWR